jgi:glycerol-1-phosphate dehydrogenase [NAD(P)+]
LSAGLTGAKATAERVRGQRLSGSEPDIEVVVARDAPARLVARAEAERWRDALVVMDQNTREAAGARTAKALTDAGVRVRELVFPQRSGLLAGTDEVERVRGQLRDGDVPIAVGSGVVTDIVRYAAHLSGVDFVSVPTAASMDGYASSVAALQLQGVKVTFPARAPAAIFADPGVAAAAPPELTRSGIGDLLAKATARVDWLAAHLLYGEPFSERVQKRVGEPLAVAVANVPALLAGDEEAIEALLGGLVQSGIAMAIAGNSRPASGCEHHASHFWDLLAARGLRAHTPHGLQVGYASHFAMRLQSFAFAGGVASLVPPAPVEHPLGKSTREWLGEPSPDIVAAVSDKRKFVDAVPTSWPGDAEGWERVRAGIAPALQDFPRVSDALLRAGIPAEPGYLDLDERTLRATFRYATRLRARYTTVDFLEGQGLLDQAIEAMLA